MIIYKYKLEQNPLVHQEIQLPWKHRILYAGEQYGELYVWVAVLDSDFEVKKRFYVLGTGIQNNHLEIGDLENLCYLNTVQMDNGLVWHVHHVFE